MNAPSGNNPEDLAKQKLTEACRAMDRADRLRWVLIVGQVLLAVVLALALVDYWLMLSVSGRAVGVLVLAALFIFGMVRLVRYFLRPTPLKQGALEIESNRPDLGCEVSTAAEYITGERKIEHQYEPELAAALEAKTARALALAPAARAKLVGIALLLGVTLLGLVILVLAAPGGLTALERTTVPFSKAHYTSVDVKPGDFEVAVGHNVDITNVFSGRLPKDARISLAEAANLHWQTAALAGGTQGIYIHSLTNLQTDLVYRVAGNDALSPDYKITTYVPPTVRDFTVRLSYPPYTKLSPGVQKSPEIAALRATTAEIRIQPSVALKQAKMRFAHSPEIAFSSEADGSWVSTVPITKDAEYWIEMADLKGHPGVNEKPYHIKALPDNPPKVEISEPGKDIRSTATNKVLVKISVADDFGIDQIKLVYNKLGGEQKTIDAEVTARKKGEVVANAELDLAPMDLKEYELVAYHAEATDNNTLDGPGVGKSQVYFIEISNKEDTNSPPLAQTPGQQVNLLVIQKQIVADTTAMAADATADKFKDMAVRQRDAAEFGRMYLEAISGGGSEAAANEMHAALTDMELAGTQLDKQQRTEAIPREESALAHLYQVVKLMPELQNLPTKPTADQKPPPSPKVQVVLNAIKEKKKDQPDNKELQEALDQAQDLARAQASLNQAMRNAAESSGKGQEQAQGQGQGQGQGEGKGQGQGQGKGELAAKQDDAKSGNKSDQAQSKAPGQGQGQGKGKGQGQGKGEQAAKQNDPKSGDKSEQAQAKAPEQGQDGKKGDAPPEAQAQEAGESPEQIAAKEDQLSKEAEALAELLQRLAGNDKRLGHNLGNAAKGGAVKMAAAGKSMAAGNSTAAGEHGFQGELALRNVADQLERILKNRPEATDIAHEDSPKEYETLISEYLKRLSHAE